MPDVLHPGWWVVLAAALVSTALALRGGACVRRGGVAERCRGLLGEDGTATVEFALVLPVLMFFVLLLLQSSLLMVGNNVVHYAAFAATRSAMTQVGADDSAIGAEGRNVVWVAEGSPKFDAIRAAAYFAVMPVCGESSTEPGDVQAERWVEAVRGYMRSSGQGEPAWVDRLLGPRLRYAARNTRVNLLRTSVGPEGVAFEPMREGAVYRFDPHEAVTVSVAHRMFLSVPYVSRLFADGRLSGPVGEAGYYTDIEARSTLINEGLATALPPEPALPRYVRGED